MYCTARCCQLVLHRCHWLVYWCHGNSSNKTRQRTWRRNAQEGTLASGTDCLETYCGHGVTISISIVWREFIVSNLSVLRKENNIWVSYQKSTIVTSLTTSSGKNHALNFNFPSISGKQRKTPRPFIYVRFSVRWVQEHFETGSDRILTKVIQVHLWNLIEYLTFNI